MTILIRFEKEKTKLQFAVKKPRKTKSIESLTWTQIILCLVILELWSGLIMVTRQVQFCCIFAATKDKFYYFLRNCFTLVLRILITIIPAGQ